MGKKRHKKGYVPQARVRQKKTKGKLQFVDVIYMEKKRVPDPEDPSRLVDQVHAVCTCDQWRSSDEATTFAKIGKEAKEHVEATGHQLRSH